jgi:hypothetical protein
MQEQPTSHANPHQPAPRKPYQKPLLEAVQLRVKEEVLATCRTGSSATGQASSCLPGACFS